MSDQSPNQNAEYRRLRRHLIEVHGYEDAYFDIDYAKSGPITEVSTLRWLHAHHVKTREHPRGCDPRG